MYKRLIKAKLKEKSSKYIIFSIFLIFILSFLSIKNEFFYNVINYFDYYLSYYISKYLNGNINNLIIDGKILIYIENDVQNIMSSLYLYVLSFGQSPFKIYSFLVPLLVFFNVNSNMYEDIYNNCCSTKILRMGINSYNKKTIMSEVIYNSLIITLPRILYLIILCIFFYNGISYNHVIVNASYVNEAFLYNAYVYNPLLLIALDFLVSFAYVSILTLISIFVTCFFKNKSICTLVFITTIMVYSLIMYVLSITPLIFYNSIFSYFSLGFCDKLIEPIIMVITQLLIWYIITRLTLKRKIGKTL